MGQVLELRRLKAAYEEVRANHGAAGVDGVSVEEFGHRLEENLLQLISELRQRTYRPLPVKRVLIPKPDGGQRLLGIPAVRDRVVQQAVLRVLEPIFEADFSSHSHGFRPRRSCFSALRELYGQIRAGHLCIVDVDIEKFFDTIAHEPLIDAVAEKVADGSVLRLIRLFLGALVQDGYRLVRPKAGTPQGGVISPLLANIYLAKLDRVLEAEGMTFVRYADDVRLLSRTPAGARSALKRTEEVLSELELRLNTKKTKLVSVHQGVDFLGYRLIAVKGRLKAYINPKVIERFRDEVRRLTRRTAGMSFVTMIDRLNFYLRGWGEYFKRAQVSGVLDRLDQWVARRVRAYRAKRWRNTYWRRYPNQYLYGKLGLVRLYALRRDFHREFTARRYRQPSCRA
jgi:group II intron reverse transcriptase/maturase